MTTYLVTDYDGRVLYYLADTPPAGAITETPPADMTDDNHHDYKWVDGGWIYDPVKQTSGRTLEEQVLLLSELVDDLIVASLEV